VQAALERSVANGKLELRAMSQQHAAAIRHAAAFEAEADGLRKMITTHGASAEMPGAIELMQQARLQQAAAESRATAESERLAAAQEVARLAKDDQQRLATEVAALEARQASAARDAAASARQRTIVERELRSAKQRLAAVEAEAALTRERTQHTRQRSGMLQGELELSHAQLAAQSRELDELRRVVARQRVTGEALTAEREAISDGGSELRRALAASRAREKALEVELKRSELESAALRMGPKAAEEAASLREELERAQDAAAHAQAALDVKSHSLREAHAAHRGASAEIEARSQREEALGAQLEGSRASARKAEARVVELTRELHGAKEKKTREQINFQKAEELSQALVEQAKEKQKEKESHSVSSSPPRLCAHVSHSNFGFASDRRQRCAHFHEGGLTRVFSHPRITPRVDTPNVDTPI